jgi:transmembrane sensor
MTEIKIDIELLERFLQNKCTEAEAEGVIKWLQDTQNELQARSLLHGLWEKGQLPGSNNMPDFESLLDKVHHRINMRTEDHEDDNDENEGLSWAGFSQIVYKIAAFALIPMILFNIYSYNQRNPSEILSEKKLTYREVASAYGVKTKLELPDGSTVMLNGGSSIKYAENFEDTARQVELSGEAFFNVAKNQEKPFIVKTNKLNIRAIGTAFNVRAYPEEKNTETALVEGVVKIGAENLKPEIMNEHHVAFYENENQKLEIRETNTDVFTAWMQGKLILRNTSMNEVTRLLARWYNIDFVIKNPEIQQYSFTATFRNENIYQVMDLLKLATPIEYKIIDRKKNKDNSFSRMKVEIRIRENN